MRLSPSKSSTAEFDMRDLRFFHSFMTAAHPSFPLESEHAWLMEVPVIAQQVSISDVVTWTKRSKTADRFEVSISKLCDPLSGSCTSQCKHRIGPRVNSTKIPLLRNPRHQLPGRLDLLSRSIRQRPRHRCACDMLRLDLHFFVHGRSFQQLPRPDSWLLLTLTPDVAGGIHVSILPPKGVY